MSVLARNKCYILPYCQGTDPCGEVTYFAKYSLTLPLVPTGSTFSREHSYKVSSNWMPSFFLIKLCRTQQALMMSQKSGFTSIGLWNILHLLAKIPKVYSTILRALGNLWLYIRFRNVTICCDMAVTRALIRRTPRHTQAQMAWIILLRHWAEPWGLQYSVYCSPVIFQMSSF